MTDNMTRDTILDLIKILDKGISMEMNAVKFYATMAGVARSETGRRLFRKLSDSERDHVRKLLDKRGEFAAHRSVKGTVGEYNHDESLSEIRGTFETGNYATDEEILREAAKNEMAAYSYYQKKMTITENPSIKQLLKEFAYEEEQHWLFFKRQINNVDASGTWLIAGNVSI